VKKVVCEKVVLVVKLRTLVKQTLNHFVFGSELLLQLFYGIKESVVGS
jgi:hypothetical protein